MHGAGLTDDRSYTFRLDDAPYEKDDACDGGDNSFGSKEMATGWQG